MGMKPSPREVARLAYELFVARGAHHGFDREDWLEAERQLTVATEASPKKAATTPSRGRTLTPA
jgi:hypothetical protein